MPATMKRYQSLRHVSPVVEGGLSKKVRPFRAVPERFSSILLAAAFHYSGAAPKGLFRVRPSEARQSVGVQSARPSARLVRNKCRQRQPTPCDVAKTPATALVNTCDSRSQCVREGQVPEDGRVTGMRGRHEGAGGNRVIRSRLAERCWHEPRMEVANLLQRILDGGEKDE